MTGATSCDDHTYGPTGYAEWHEWAERKSTTHTQQRCRGCRLWLIWMPIGGAS